MDSLILHNSNHLEIEREEFVDLIVIWSYLYCSCMISYPMYLSSHSYSCCKGHQIYQRDHWVASPMSQQIYLKTSLWSRLYQQIECWHLTFCPWRIGGKQVVLSQPLCLGSALCCYPKVKTRIHIRHEEATKTYNSYCRKHWKQQVKSCYGKLIIWKHINQNKSMLLNSKPFWSIYINIKATKVGIVELSNVSRHTEPGHALFLFSALDEETLYLNTFITLSHCLNKSMRDRQRDDTTIQEETFMV